MTYEAHLQSWEVPQIFPFKSMFGLSRENTCIASTRTPFAWGYTYNGPYNHYACKTGAIFETKKMNLEYEAMQTKRNLQRMRSEIDRLKLLRRPIDPITRRPPDAEYIYLCPDL